MSTLKTAEGVTMAFRAFCLDCKTFHDIRTCPGTPLIKEMSDWEYKHRGHRIEFNSRDRDIPRDYDDSQAMKTGMAPWFLNFKENNNFQFAFQTAVNMTFTTLNSLASDASLLAGASALAVDNGATGCPLEIGVSAFIKNNSSAPTAGKEIDIFAYAAIDEVPTYPDVLLGTDALKTITTAAIQNTGMRQMTSLIIANTGNQVNPMCPTALSALFGVMPRYWSIYVVHNSGNALNSAGNQFTYKGVYVQG